MRLLLSLSLLATALPRAEAQERSAITLAWVRGAGAETCPSNRELQGRVGERLGYDPFVMDAPVSLEAVVERAEDEWSAHVYKRGPAGELLGERSLVNRATDCEALADAIVLALALAIDPDAALRPRPEAPSDPPAASEEEAVPADPAPDPPADSPPPAPARPRDRARLAFGAAVARAQVPGWGYGLRLAVDGPILRWTVDAQPPSFRRPSFRREPGPHPPAPVQVKSRARRASTPFVPRRPCSRTPGPISNPIPARR